MAEQKKGYAVRVTTERGEDMYLRRGHRPGYGPVVRFRTRKDAELAIATFQPGLEDGWHADIVPYSEAGRPAGQGHATRCGTRWRGRSGR